jgi:putative membrane protein
MGAAVMGLWWIWPTLVVIGLGLLGVLTYRIASNRSGTHTTPGAGSARRILDERFARGEIDADDYHRRRAELR